VAAPNVYEITKCALSSASHVCLGKVEHAWTKDRPALMPSNPLFKPLYVENEGLMENIFISNL
jgi:hypothetical protein